MGHPAIGQFDLLFAEIENSMSKGLIVYGKDDSRNGTMCTLSPSERINNSRSWVSGLMVSRYDPGHGAALDGTKLPKM
jgi:hypothetical protein